MKKLGKMHQKQPITIEVFEAAIRFKIRGIEKKRELLNIKRACKCKSIINSNNLIL